MRSDRNIPMRGKPKTLEATILNDLKAKMGMIVVRERKEMKEMARFRRKLGGFCCTYKLCNSASIASIGQLDMALLDNLVRQCILSHTTSQEPARYIMK